MDPVSEGRSSDTGIRGLRKARIDIQPGMPLQFLEEEAAEIDTVPSDQREESRRIAQTLKTYRAAAKELLRTRYQHLAPYAPDHLSEPTDVTVICCTDGIVVRYDRCDTDRPVIRAGALNASLTQAAPALSDGLVHFPNSSSYEPPEGGIQFQLNKFDATGATTPLSTVRPHIFAPSSYPPDFILPLPPHRPVPLVSIPSDIEILMDLETTDANPAPYAVEKKQRFLTRSPIKLEVGWRALECYPRLPAQYWNPDFAPLWAESDLLGAFAERRFRDDQFSALDPNTGGRTRYFDLINQLELLLDGPEEPAHQFLKAHPELLSPTHAKFWSKLRFGESVSDFVFRGPTGDYLLVEIESPLRELFRKDGQPRAELTHAFNQLTDWRIFIEQNLEHSQTVLGLEGISSHPDLLIVIGRSGGLTPANRSKLVALQSQIPRLKILTYDDLVQAARLVGANLFGARPVIGHNVEVYVIPQTTEDLPVN